MATTVRTNGLQHAISLGNIEISARTNSIYAPARCYESEDENMGRRKNRSHTISYYPRTPVYSKGDIREQYCLTDRQLNSIDRPRRERLFGCLSGRGAPQSFLGVCVGRRAPSDENLADYAPFHKYPRYPHDLLQYDEDLESSYFRRRPTSILSSGSTMDSKRYTWMSTEEEAIRLEGPRPICTEYDDFQRGPYVVGSYPLKQFLSQSTEHLAGLYRCPAHIGVPPPPPPPVLPVDSALPRMKHVSFARSHTLTSFDEMSKGLRSSGRMSSTRSQERLIGGKKPCSTISSLQQQQQQLQEQQFQQQKRQTTLSGLQMQQQQQQQQLAQSAAYHHLHHPQLLTHSDLTAQQSLPPQLQSSLSSDVIKPLSTTRQLPSLQSQSSIPSKVGQQVLIVPQQQSHHEPEVLVVEKIKRGAMKTQATQTEVYGGRKGISAHHLSLSPRTIHRVKMVSQGAQTNGMLNGRKLTKSLSEMTRGKVSMSSDKPKCDELKPSTEHEQLHRTQSEEPPRSPSMIPHGAAYFQRYSEPLQPHMPPQTNDQVIPSMSYQSDHSRHSPQDSLTSNQFPESICITGTTPIPISGSNLSRENYEKFSLENTLSESSSISRANSTIQRVPSLTGVNIQSGIDYESNSLPRRTCGHHRMEEYYSYSLPRRDHYHPHDLCRHVTGCTEYEILNNTSGKTRDKLSPHDDSVNLNQYTDKRRASMLPDIAPKTHITLRRQSMPPFMDSHHIAAMLIPSELTSDTGSDQAEDEPKELLDDGKSTEQDAESYEVQEEQEIFIDFKPHISPTPSPRGRRKKLQKTLSDGEILFEKRQDNIRENVLIASASEEDLKPQNGDTTTIEYQYQNIPIKDEGICDKQNLLTIPSPEGDISLRSKREAFRKRSISLEDSTTDGHLKQPKSAPPSPCQDELSVHVQSAYPSSDSLANDLTRDHSDGIWNESQATVLPVENKDESNLSRLTPSSKRKHLILQHQQRSSIDTDALEMDEQFSSDQSLPCLPPHALKPVGTQTVTPSQLISEAISSAASSGAPTPPSISVTPSLSAEGDDHDMSLLFASSSRRSSRALSPALQEKRVVEPLIHSHSPQRFPDTSEVQASSVQAEKFTTRTDSGPKNNTDISECSTNTDEYVTCTDNSKRAPVSAQSSQTVTHDGSSFESASSLYSTRGDGLSEEAPRPDDEPPDEQLIPATIMKLSPSHSAADKTSPVPSRMKTESVSDDERSERRYSSSGYYESPHDEERRSAIKYRKTRERIDEERRRKRNSMKLDIERENLRALTSPIKKPSPGFKQISPEDRMAMNVLDGTSPVKSKRIRPKIRRQLRKTSMSREDSFSKKSNKGTCVKSPERTLKSSTERLNERIERPGEYPMEQPIQQTTRLSPSKPCKYTKSISSPKKQITNAGSQQRLKAKSIESLRSVSPGSDSVFYSEADLVPDQQVHCLHCGKEVEIVTAASESQESISAVNKTALDIVKPPADFADSPITTKTSQRLYKKMDKRFRSEERHGDRRHYRNRQENVRAKSEERGREKSTSSSPALRPAGSSPCIMPDDSESRRSSGADIDQTIYHGHYRVGLYTRLTDSDVWIQLDHQSFDRHRDRRGSTDSEKTFHQKYQVILHRLVQRRCTLEMYQRQKSNSFSIDKTVVVSSASGEFGFRIHGSKPVVVAAIEPDTPAENSGLEVGDIIISVNGIPVLDKHHTEVVKIAHAGYETLELEVARTIGVLMNEQQESASPALYTGYLWRQSGQVKGSPNSKKWVRRWFCLRPDYCLYYYKTDSDTQPVGAVILTNHTVEHCSSDVGKPHAFKIASDEGIPLFLAAETQESTDRWVAVMSHASAQGDPWLEMSTRNLRLPPNGISRPDCFGYLMKLGSRWCGWSKRYCVLKDACLYFYQDVNSKSAFGMTCLQGYKVVTMSSNAAGRKNAFEVVPPDQKLRHYYFSAESDMDKKRWISALEYSIDRWIKAG